MPFDTPKQLQNFVKNKFESYFNVDVLVGRNSAFRIGRDIYSPEPDIAVGPFAVGTRQYEDEYDRMTESFKDFIEKCINYHNNNLRHYRTGLQRPDFSLFGGSSAVNRNARCFISVEIEKSPPTKKHLLGSAINAVALGRVGLLVGFSDKKVEDFLRCLKYLGFLKSVNKPSINFNNGLVLSKNQFVEILDNL